jgi:hypothetical protein
MRSSRFASFPIVVVACVLAAPCAYAEDVGAPSADLASAQKPLASSRSAKARADERWPFAVVRFDGSLDRGLGVRTTSSTGTGSYQVFFTRDVTQCSHVVSVSGRGTDDVNGVADAAHIFRKPKGLYVNTFSIHVDPATNSLIRSDADFHLQVSCPPAQ